MPISTTAPTTSNDSCAKDCDSHGAADRFDPARYYTGDYFSGGHADGYADYRGAEAVLRREFLRTVGFLRRYKQSGRLLDVELTRPAK